MSQNKAFFQIVDGKLIRIDPETYKETQHKPKRKVVMNRPGHVRPLHRRKR